MQWLQHLDTEVFRLINENWVNPFFNWLMPFASGNDYFHPAVIILGALLLWKGGIRGLTCVIMLALIVPIGDGLITNMLKQAIGRDRPFLALEGVRLLVGRAGSFSMPSGHAANWFAAAMVAFVYYRRSAWVMLPLAILVSYSRIYVGVHYPSDVLAGAALGAGYAVACLWLFDSLWAWAGQKWFPLWWEHVPSLVAFRPAEKLDEEETVYTAPPPPPTRGLAPAGFKAPHVTTDQHWLRLGYVCIGALLLVRLIFIDTKLIQLSEDEAYQWLWSKHLDLSYYSKPPFIAYTQFLGTSLWGDTAFGVRFFSPVITALISVLVLRLFTREVNARAGFFLLLVATTAPLASVGAVLMTVDPLSVLFWTAAMLAGWKAIQPEGTTSDWFWVGLWMGFGFLSKYTALLQLLCWAVLFVVWPPARKQLRRPGPYLALLVNALCTLPVLIWNSQRGWITVTHLGENAGIHSAWQPTLRYFGEFLGSEFGLLNPVFFVATVWAAIALWKGSRRSPLLIFLFCMGAPLFLAYLFYSFHSRILPNWIAPSVLPLFCMMVIYWDTRFRLGTSWIKPWLKTGLILGMILVVLGHDTNLVKTASGYYLPLKLDPLHRVREWDKVALAVDTPRQQLLTEGKPAFIITDHYGMAGEISFYLPEARENVCKTPVVYYQTSPIPRNQFYFWPGYTERKGDNAIFVRELDRDHPNPVPAPKILEEQFDSITDLGVTNVLYHGQSVLRPLQLFACHGLR